jgi:hypothetical protein
VLKIEGLACTFRRSAPEFLRRARGFLSAGGDVLHAGSISSVVSSPSLAYDLIDRRLDETGSDPLILSPLR